MIRLFIAISPPPEIRFFIQGLGRSIPGARPTPDEQLHLTLHFLGDVEGSLFNDVREELLEIQQEPFQLQIKGVGHFPPRGTPKVIWAGIAPSDELLRLHKRVGSTLRGCGVELEKRKFAPHITLARLRNSPLQRVTTFLAGNSFLESPPFTVDSFHLFSSQLGPKGALHTLEETYHLGAGKTLGKLESGQMQDADNLAPPRRSSN